MKCTPLPWQRFGGYMDGYGIVGDGKTVVRRVGDNSMDLDRHSADAKLIVRACNAHSDLLAALLYLDRKFGHKINCEDADIVEAAIAAARGEAKMQAKELKDDQDVVPDRLAERGVIGAYTQDDPRAKEVWHG